MEYSGLRTDCKETSIREVPLNLLASIFSHLDIHHQTRAYRVCRMWSDVISGSWPLEHVEINCQLGQDRRTSYPAEYYADVGMDSQEAKVDTMLHVALTARTKILTLCNISLSHRRIVLLIVNRLKEENRQLPILCFKNCVVGVEMALYPWHERIDHSWNNYGNLLLLIHHRSCVKVLLQNYTIENIMHYPILFCPTLPFIQGMLKKGGSTGTISRLVMDCGKSATHVFRSLLTALNTDWPSVGEDIRQSVSAIHQQWLLQNNDHMNPHKWAAFRQVVDLFTYHTICDVSYKQYPTNRDEVEHISIAHLNDMTISLLALFFKAYEANY